MPYPKLKLVPVPTEQEAEWDPELLCTFWRENSSFFLYGIEQLFLSNPVCSVDCVVARFFWHLGQVVTKAFINRSCVFETVAIIYSIPFYFAQFNVEHRKLILFR